MKNNIYTYKVADFAFRIYFTEGQQNDTTLIPSYNPFSIDNKDIIEDDLLFQLEVDDNLSPVSKTERTRIRIVDTGNGDTVVDHCSNGGYQFLIKDIQGNSCCLLITNKDFSSCQCALRGTHAMRSFGLNNALMLAFAFSSSRYNTLLLHASVVLLNGWGYAFTAKSGTGKSTQSSNWLNNIPGCDLLNDDNPVVRVINNTPYIYGSPWSGKTPCYKNIKARLGAVTKINRALANRVEPAKPLEAFTSLLEGCSTMKWDDDIYCNINNTITKVVELSPNYNLYCLPNSESAIVCHKAISR